MMRMTVKDLIGKLYPNWKIIFVQHHQAKANGNKKCRCGGRIFKQKSWNYCLHILKKGKMKNCSKILYILLGEIFIFFYCNSFRILFNVFVRHKTKLCSLNDTNSWNRWNPDCDIMWKMRKNVSIIMSFFVEFSS